MFREEMDLTQAYREFIHAAMGINGTRINFASATQFVAMDAQTEFVFLLIDANAFLVLCEIKPVFVLTFAQKDAKMEFAIRTTTASATMDIKLMRAENFVFQSAQILVKMEIAQHLKHAFAMKDSISIPAIESVSS